MTTPGIHLEGNGRSKLTNQLTPQVEGGLQEWESQEKHKEHILTTSAVKGGDGVALFYLALKKSVSIDIYFWVKRSSVVTTPARGLHLEKYGGIFLWETPGPSYLCGRSGRVLCFSPVRRKTHVRQTS